VSSLDVAPGHSAHLVVAANEFSSASVINKVVVTTNALDSSPGFVDITRNLPARFVTRVAFDPGDSTVIFATLGGFAADTPGSPGHVFRTTIAGATWTNISPRSDIPVNAIALDCTTSPATIYLGTDTGVLRSNDGGATWHSVDDIHLPNAAVAALDLNPQAGVLRAATWGRGVFELSTPTGPAIAIDQSALRFGETCLTGSELPITVRNIGIQDLVVNSVQRLSGSTAFTVQSSPATPLTIAPGAQVVFGVRFTPGGAGVVDSAIIRVVTNDPTAPTVDLVATGTLETTPPNIAALTPSPALLAPPNHKMAAVTIAVKVTDNCDTAVAQSCQIVAITSNEPISGVGDGDTAPDWAITGKLAANLRSERSGTGSGRVYTLTVQCTDAAGNSTTETTTVTVPK
jgi:hypothetical protein